jgi:TniQ
MVMAQDIDEIALPHLPIWEMSLPDVPTRSKIYSLAPLGLNGPLVESLTSYLCRLAYEHHVEVGTLVQHSIAPMLGKHYIAETHGRGVSSFLRYAGPINGNGLMASDWVDTLEALTLRADLAQLTLLVSTDVLSQRDLLQPVRQWCPRCYDSWRRQGAIIYEPLLWSINGIAVCPEHSRHLERRCPHCSASLPWLTWHSRPGYCSACGKWLGRADGQSQVEEQERYLAETVGDFLTHIPRLPLAIPREGVIQSLRQLITTTADGNMAAFARSLRRPKTSLWELVQGYFPPSLPFVLQLCSQFHLPLLPLLLGRERVAPGESPVSQEQPPTRDARCPFNREKVQRALEAILADQQSGPLSMREVAQRLDHPVRTIETHFPVLCREISRRYADFRRQQGQRRKARLRQRICEAAHIVLIQGEKLTYRRVGTLVGEPGCFREYEARMALLDIRSRADEQNSLE